MGKGEALGETEALARLIRRSRALDAAAKRSWLRVLPHLATRDRARLRQILEAEGAEPWAAPPEDAPPR